MNIEAVIQEKVRALPVVKQEKVLAFLEDLESDETNGSKIDEGAPKKSKRYSFVGIGASERGDLSQRVDEILAQGANEREGWSLPE